MENLDEAFDQVYNLRTRTRVALREGLATDELDSARVYAGTRMWQVFASDDEGRSRRLIAEWLPPVHSGWTATMT